MHHRLQQWCWQLASYYSGCSTLYCTISPFLAN